MLREPQEMDVNQEKVLMRVDFNVDLENGKIVDPSRIIAHLPSIQKYLGWEPEKLILLAHLSPDSGPISLNPIAQYLAERLGLKQPVLIKFKDETIRNGFHLGQKLFLLENVRFHREEEENNLKFAQRLAAMGDIFILDALSVAHRNHASVSGIARVKRLKAFAGPLLIEEVTVLSEVLTNPQRPFVVLIGGTIAKAKASVIQSLLPIADFICLGGQIGKSPDIQNQYKDNCKVLLTVDGPPEDIGPETSKKFREFIKNAKTILWAGPMGWFENYLYTYGTKTIADAIANNESAFSIVAGGDTQKALVRFGLKDKIKFISQGGGATLEFLAGNKLPGLEALGYYQRS